MLRINRLFATTLLVPVLTVYLSIPSAFAELGFQDVPPSSPSFTAIMDLKSRGIVHGAEDGKFYAERVVSRVELLKMSFLSAGITPSLSLGSLPSDVSVDTWYAPYVSEAISRNIAAGYPDGFFRPNQTVTKIEAIKILLNTQQVSLAAPSRQHFLDVPITAWYAPYTHYVAAKNLLYQTNEEFHVDEPMKRRDTAELIYRLLTVHEQHLDRFEHLESLPTPRTDSIGIKAFRDIELDQELPRTFVIGEVYPVSGKVLKTDVRNVTAHLVQGKEQIMISETEPEAQVFDLALSFDHPGKFQLMILPGVSGLAKGEEIVVVAPLAPIAPAPRAADNLRVQQDDNETIFSWDSDSNLTKLQFTQSDLSLTKILSAGQHEWSADFSDFQYFEPGAITWGVETSESSDGTAFGQTTNWSMPVTSSFSASNHYFSFLDEDALSLDAPFPYQADLNDRITVKGQALHDLASDAKLVKPDGVSIETLFMSSESVLKAGETFEITWKVDHPGVYVLELNELDGFAALNSPIYVSTTIPLIPDYDDLKHLARDPSTPLSSAALENRRIVFLNLINDVRMRAGVMPVQLDENLNTLAQFRSDDMADRDYFSHNSPEGVTPSEQRIELGISTVTGENIALGPNLLTTHEGFLRSAIHLENILDPSWTRVGLGIALTDIGQFSGSYIVTQEFSVRSLQTTPLSSSELQQLKDLLYSETNEHRDAENLDSLTRQWSLEPLLDEWLNDQSKSLQNLLSAQNVGAGMILSTTAQYSGSLVENIGRSANFLDPSFENIAIGLRQVGEQIEMVFVLTP